MDHILDLVGQLHRVKNLIQGCESLSVASTDGLIMATTHDELRKGELLAAVTSLLLNTTASLLQPFNAGECRALDFRGDRQVLVTRLPDARGAFLVCVLHPGAHAVNLDEPTLRAVVGNVPNLLHAQDVTFARRWLLQRDKTSRIPVRNRLLIGRGHHCDIVLPSARVNAEHLEVQVVGDRLQATDLDTDNGTKLNGRQFEGCVEMNVGDRLTFPKCGSLTVLAVDPEGRELGADGEPVKSGAEKRRKKSESRST